MNQPNDPGSPKLRSSVERPLTSEEWTLLRPSLAYAYKKKQHTARMILKDVSNRGFIVTEKVLRSRFKVWHIDDKNKRKSTGPISGNTNRICESRSPSCVDPKSRRISTETLQSNNDTDSVSSDATIDQDNDALSYASTHALSLDNESSLRSGIPCQLRLETRLQQQRLTWAIAAWYDHLSCVRNDALSIDLETQNTSQLFETLSNGLWMSLEKPRSGVKLLTNAGPDILTVFQSSDPGLVTTILCSLIWWRYLADTNETYRQYADVVFACLLRISHHKLGVAHPVTLLIHALIHERMSSDVCDNLCKAIELNYIRKPGTGTQCAAQLRVLFGRILISQRRYVDVEHWYNCLVRDDAFCLHVTSHADALRVLAESRMRRGLYVEAENALDEALGCLEDNGLQRSPEMCTTLRQYARLRGRMGDLTSSELLIGKCIQVARLTGLDEMVLRTACYLWALYKEMAREDLAAILAEYCPEVLDE